MSSTRFSEGLPGEGRKRYPTDWSRSKTVRVSSLTRGLDLKIEAGPNLNLRRTAVFSCLLGLKPELGAVSNAGIDIDLGQEL